MPHIIRNLLTVNWKTPSDIKNGRSYECVSFRDYNSDRIYFRKWFVKFYVK